MNYLILINLFNTGLQIKPRGHDQIRTNKVQREGLQVESLPGERLQEGSLLWRGRSDLVQR